jgi:hypothetical protein
LTKWLRDLIFGELKPLFLRIRSLDESKKNLILKDFFTLLFPTFAKNYHEKLVVISKDFRRAFNNWRNVLWKRLLERHEKYKNHNNKEKIKATSYIKNRHINEIFNPWLKFTSKLLTIENEVILKNLILFGFYCLENYPQDAAHEKFFSFNGSLYTVNCDFPSTSGYNVATSIDLSKYDVVYSICTTSDVDSDISD